MRPSARRAGSLKRPRWSRLYKLNPDEMANADLKQAVTKLAPVHTKLQLVKATPD